MTNDAALQRIQNLLAKAESTDSQPEAEACYAKAEELMVKYQIDEAMLEAGGAGRREEPTLEKFAYATQVYRPAKARLLHKIAGMHNVRMVLYPGYRRTETSSRTFFAALIGFPSDVRFVKMLYLSIVLQAERGVAQAWTGAGRPSYAWRHSYVSGYVSGVASKMQAAHRTANATRASAERSVPGTELVLRSKAEAVQALCDQAFPSLRSARVGMRNVYGGAFDSGRRDGARADVSGGRGQMRGATAAIKP